MLVSVYMKKEGDMVVIFNKKKYNKLITLGSSGIVFANPSFVHTPLCDYNYAFYMKSAASTVREDTFIRNLDSLPLGLKTLAGDPEGWVSECSEVEVDLAGVNAILQARWPSFDITWIRSAYNWVDSASLSYLDVDAITSLSDVEFLGYYADEINRLSQRSIPEMTGAMRDSAFRNTLAFLGGNSTVKNIYLRTNDLYGSGQNREKVCKNSLKQMGYYSDFEQAVMHRVFDIVIGITVDNTDSEEFD